MVQFIPQYMVPVVGLVVGAAIGQVWASGRTDQKA
jgi:hypothetical protein